MSIGLVDDPSLVRHEDVLGVLVHRRVCLERLVRVTRGGLASQLPAPGKPRPEYDASHHSPSHQTRLGNSANTPMSPRRDATPHSRVPAAGHQTVGFVAMV